MRILIIEDEKRLADILANMIGDSGYCTDIARDGLEGLDPAKGSIYDAITLDVMLPGLNRLDILSRLRNNRITTPVLMLAAKSALAGRVRGLDTGADYYLTKSFKNREFLACPRAVLCRQADVTPGSFTYSDLFLIPSTSQLSCSGQAASLGARELGLIRLLIQNYNQFLLEEMLLMKVWGYDSSINTSSVEAYISFPRKKLSLSDSSVRITVIWNVGYRLEVS